MTDDGVLFSNVGFLTTGVKEVLGSHPSEKRSRSKGEFTVE